ncbi:MAG: MlaD family protein [Rhodococcus sp. (in: high G+C Gram-positive bacteria)]
MKRRILQLGAVVVAVAVLAAGYFMFTAATRTTVVAEFPSTTGLCAGDDVRVLGVEVGKVASIDPEGDFATVTMHIDSDVEIPADAKAVIIA